MKREFLYPAALELKQTSKSSRMADFLGIHLETDSNCFHLSVYDKRKEFPFRVRRYPMMASLIPRTIPYGVFLGQLHRGYRICSGADDFVSNGVEVAEILRDNGCAVNKSKRLFMAFVAKNSPRRSNWVKKQFCQRLGSRIRG